MVLCLIIACVFFATSWITHGWCADEAKYTTKYDDLDVDAIVRSPRLLKNYVNCVLERGPCTPEGSELKKNIPEAIQTDCEKCSVKQKQLTDKVLQHLIDNEPTYWKTLQEKYDPDNVYTKQYLDSKIENKK